MRLLVNEQAIYGLTTPVGYSRTRGLYRGAETYRADPTGVVLGCRFFVKPGYLLRAKLEILKHLPLYVHKEDPRRAGDTPPPVTVSTPINSVYLDT